jgi:hypothetical protein
MGYSVCWIGFHGISKPDACAVAGYRDTGEPDEERESAVSAARISDRWSVVNFNNNMFPEIAETDSLALLSKNRAILLCQVSERMMASGVALWRDGEQVWEITHELDKSADNCEVTGLPPEVFHGIFEAAEAKKHRISGTQDDFDVFFDVPNDVAQAIVGYKYNQDDDPGFTELESPF